MIISWVQPANMCIKLGYSSIYLTSFLGLALPSILIMYVHWNEPGNKATSIDNNLILSVQINGNKGDSQIYRMKMLTNP